MSATHTATIAHRNEANGYSDEELTDNSVDANGDPLSSGNGLKVASSSEEDVASCSSKDDEKDEVIYLKTR